MNSAQSYVAIILQAYLQLPDTPKRINRLDRKLAQEFYDQGIAIETVQAALLLASLRRKRQQNVPALPPIRSLHYFLPIIREITASPLPKDYIEYLRKTAAAQLT